MKIKWVSLLSGACLFLTPWTLGQRIASPEELLGFPVGADRRLADWEQIVGYFHMLDEASPRLQVQELGRTTLNRPFLLAIIAHPEVLARLDSYREIQEKLADPRKVEGSPESLIERGKTIVLITCAIHSTEVASAQMSMEFAYELAVARDRETQEILENVVLLLVPSLNPDGIDIVNHWYSKTLGTPAEGTPPPELYHAYTGHDNNRDWYMFTQKETRLAVEKIHNIWHPQIVLDVHQMRPYGARIFVPPFIDPIDPNVDPALQAGIVRLGATLFTELIQRGKEGAVTNALYDAYAPARAYTHYHAGVRILSETASARLASPIEVRPEELQSGTDYDVRRPSWNHPLPWRGGRWTLRDIVDYEKIVLRAALVHAARYRESWLRNFYEVGRRASGRSSPYAFVIPAAQADRQGLYDLLEILRLGMVEVQVAQKPFQAAQTGWASPPFGRADRIEFPAESYVILMQQPYSAFAKTLLEIQEYPALREHPAGPLRPPYDVTAHTLGIQLGLEIYQVNHPLNVPLRRLEKPGSPDGKLDGEGSYWLIPHHNNAFARLLNRLLKQEREAYWAPNGFQEEGRGFPVGTVMVRVSEDGLNRQELLKGIPIVVQRVGRRPQLAWQRIELPRIALYRSYDPSIDEGWTRWILEQYEFSFDNLYDRDIQQGNLTGYDVILIPHQNPDRIRSGLQEPYPEQYRGGLGEQGIGALREFAASGGTVVFLGSAARIPLQDWKIEIKDTTEGLSREEFYIPGSLLRVRVNNRHPLGYGLPEEVGAMFNNNPVFELSEGLSVARYPSQDLLLSGWISGENHLANRTALAEVKMGKGRLILIGFRTQFRAQTRATYKFLFNSLYYSTTRR